MKTERDRIIALAGIIQTATLVDHIARKGMADSAAMEASIYSLFQIDAESTEAVYGGLKNIQTGLQQIVTKIPQLKLQGSESMHYALTLIHLERKLSRSPAMLKQIADSIQVASDRRQHFPILHSNIIAQLADVYAETVSTLQPRIMVNGEPTLLQNPDNANKIRALLLAGIRSAMLWRQCGGSRLQLIFGRSKAIKQAQILLENIQHEIQQTSTAI
ncbi:High frequency lysogenization protein HflD [hydrothermal vent metagenome]|uniref:High frequency lysogenization protein HflD n=1 Tax=hydrothermal vent metagenome TaxID=652676 RepID=A0A3B1B2Y2_9ZZZZ